MKNKTFVNNAFDTAIKEYIASIDEEDGMVYNSFLVVTIRTLILIYGKSEILNPYYLEAPVVFLNNLSKYGMSVSSVSLFKEDFSKYYEYELINESKKIKEKNPYFETILKYLIDMFILKKQNADVSIFEEEKFLELIYTTHTKNLYQISYGYLMGNHALELEKYYYSKANDLEMTRELDLSKTISADLNLEALNYIGVSLSSLKNMSLEDIETAKNKAYQYFEVDANKINRESNLQDQLEYVRTYGRKKVTSGNGYVDILLLMSVIVTTVSVVTIILLYCI